VSAPETIERRRAHRIRVVHGGTGRPYPDVTARLTDPVWPHWVLRVAGADVILSADVARLAGEPATTAVEVSVADPAALERFTARTYTATLGAGADLDVTLTLTAAPAQLEVVLVRPNGAAAPNRAVEAVPGGAAAGPAVPLPAVAPGSNIYRSAPTSWDPARAPFVINVDTKRRGSVAPDYARPVTRVRLIEP